MLYLIAASLLWALSFGVIKQSLVAVDPALVGFLRLLLALPLFLPFLRPGALDRRLVLALVAIGAVEYGLMYGFYLAAFAHLDAYQVALFTIATPLYVTLWDDLRGRAFDPFALAMALLAIAGAALIRYQGLALRDLLVGFALVQAANLCFAVGQVEYRRLRQRRPGLKDAPAQALLFVGGLVVTAVHTTLAGAWPSARAIDLPALLALLYLGVVASGLGFFAWSRGSVQVSAGALAVLNNLKVPFAVAVSLLAFGERTDLLRLLLGGAVMIAATILAERRAERRLRPA